MSNQRRSPVRGPARTDHWTFFRQWLRNPLATAAISPSGAQLARLMLAELPAGAQRVIELGGGTGVFTAALLAHGIHDSELMVVELNEELHQHLLQRFPGAHVACGDARELSALADSCGFAEGGAADAVVSGLGLLSMSRSTQQAIVASAFDCMRPGGRFIQFTYGPTCPVGREVQRALGLRVKRAGVALWNVPPATVYVFERES
jgi:phosphatidylethanolamine/phosphatidyl-N-methylethanolamine N-methyltransferase